MPLGYRWDSSLGLYSPHGMLSQRISDNSRPMLFDRGM